MRSLSSAIIVVPALFNITAAGAFIRHGGTQGFVMFVNVVVGLIALAAWGKSILQPTDPPATHS